ncbi:chromosome segregation protein SMC [Crateriforma conspicua]|uniref:Chromosome partition protein Smc n=1 Tax=Crateriforma conspicua TaxID=2527996 RepID=A0A5C5Y357_9PLAN|nr:chromosome segregation protein SMC [Crateriforma conspicua]TWT69239.1 Chromosome partition protein Smc [Crateriforma conspicua]
MLKALELSGFKSFADRTRFDFPDGITVVVGPNGSGKSNIVDAMKWVLGSQSPKSLRGKEMADVIFKGSQTRGPSGAAEATIIFDNSSGNLPVDAPEVHVTRRVYRSGEGEYLINKQAVRLKDVRDLIRGTGIGIDAYSLIEQGKVDRMLQANAKERRGIFEEAAGISRFKAKKTEAERRLSRIQQNLTRLGDIVDEVASRLKSLKGQASRAEKYRQATERLRELRTQVAWTDWQELTQQFETAEIELAEAIKQQEQLEIQQQELQQQRQAAELELQSIADVARQAEEQRGAWLGQIAELEGRSAADRSTVEDLRKAQASSLRRIRLLQSQAGSAAAQLRSAGQRLAEYQAELDRATQRHQEAEKQRDEIGAEVADVQTKRTENQREHLVQVRRVADLEADRQRLTQKSTEQERALQSLEQRRTESREAVELARQDAKAKAEHVAQLDQSIAESAKQIELADAKLQDNRRNARRRRDEVAALRGRLEGVCQRLDVLQDLQKRQEGVSGGVRAILDRLRELSAQKNDATRHKWAGTVRGMVADCFRVDVNVAPLIDAALGQRSQYLVVTGDLTQQAILNKEVEVNSRVGLIRIDELPTRRPGDRIRLDGIKGVVGRADRMLQCDEEDEPLARHLLSNTWIVDSLATAFNLRKLSGAGLRFVATTGELLESDGTIVVGPGGTDTGLVSRRSELDAAARERDHYQFQLNEEVAEADRLDKVVDELAAELGRLEQAHRGDVTARAAAKAESRHAEENLNHQQRELRQTEQLHEDTAGELTAVQSELQRIASEIEQGRHSIETLELQGAELDEALCGAETAFQDATKHVMAVSVDVARAEQKHEALQATIQQQHRDQNQREAAVQEVRDQANATQKRIDEANARLLDADSRLAMLHWQSQEKQAEIRQLAQAADEVRTTTKAAQKASDAAIKEAAQAGGRVHSIQSARDNARLRRDTLADRLLEDYEIDLRGTEPPEDLQPPEDREAVDREISQLRNQLQKTGSVNLEALEELEELQTRYDELHDQYQDLTAAKDSLQRIIGRINADSRRLFMDTLEAIRQNFRKLYRKSFGGGNADLILEEDEDPLEAGVEIVATPPGKPSFSNSLLSGGEKALTAVALLMAIFQYRPSPFCVLDEVDAPFDEANIGRFVTVLNEFLDQTKFVVVTHSKKTMTAATTLYGVTMQESGVSKQVSIRFEDVNEKGEIESEGEAA